MIEDFREYEPGALIEADVCVIGAGAAGITIAHEFVRNNKKVVILESGGFEYEPDVQALYKGSVVGRDYYDLDDSRLRYFGGTTGHWGGNCGPNPSIEFEKLDWIKYSGWPITRAELDPFYERAQVICGLGPYIYDERNWKVLDVDPPKFDPKKLRVLFTQFSKPIRFGEHYRSEIDSSRSVRVLLHANVVNIQTNPTGSKVEYLDLSTLQGKRGRAKARYYVLACGGIENARLLLASNTVESHGVGNRNDLVGRFFADHLGAQSATFHSDDAFRLLDIFLRQRARNHQQQYRPRILLSDTLLRTNRIPSSWVIIDYEADPEAGTKSLEFVGKRLLRRGRWPPPKDLGVAVWRVFRDLDDVAYNFHRYFVRGKDPIAPPRILTLETGISPVPNPESRVSLTKEKDALGMPRVQLDWRLSPQDKIAARNVTQAVASEIGRLGWGRVKLADWLMDDGLDFGDESGHAWHHMGTTRMATDPKHGVVDGNCLVHGTDNFYIGGSSVFPTFGVYGPTFTIVALAVRLADHLKGRLG